MGKIDVTEARVKNVMKGIPKESLAKSQKMRQTLKNTFTGMKTILNQIKMQRDLTQTSRIMIKRKKRHNLVALSISGSILLIVLIVVLVLILIF